MVMVVVTMMLAMVAKVAATGRKTNDERTRLTRTEKSSSVERKKESERASEREREREGKKRGEKKERKCVGYGMMKTR